MYATLAELKAVIPLRDLELLTDFERDGEPADDRLISALADATAEINGYIAKVATLPLIDPPRHLSVICRDLAMHRLYRNLGHDMASHDRMRRDHIETLRAIARGDLAIGGEPGGGEVITSPGAAVTDGPERLFTRDRLRGY
ncbi:gp436 family protein [Paracoccus sp. (in: a-proteobacteria)]|uniref:gp436 family protein n=1 Tax=Paracoccus sp. TaxID=267 RepID=UPI002729E802|nr:DUF1320 domain-containing protein [Paracoccus sp. (in: a-proteobacteria)]